MIHCKTAENSVIFNQIKTIEDGTCVCSGNAPVSTVRLPTVQTHDAVSFLASSCSDQARVCVMVFTLITYDTAHSSEQV